MRHIRKYKIVRKAAEYPERTPTYGFTATLEAAFAAFAKSWRREVGLVESVGQRPHPWAAEGRRDGAEVDAHLARPISAVIGKQFFGTK